MIKDVDNKFDDYSILRIQKDLFIDLTKLIYENELLLV